MDSESDHALAVALAAEEQEQAVPSSTEAEDLALALSIMESEANRESSSSSASPGAAEQQPSLTRGHQPPPAPPLHPMPPSSTLADASSALFSRFVNSLYTLPSSAVSALPSFPDLMYPQPPQQQRKPPAAPRPPPLPQVLDVLVLPMKLSQVPHHEPHNELVVVLKPDGSPPELVFVPHHQQAQLHALCVPYSGVSLVPPPPAFDGDDDFTLVDFYALKPEEVFVDVFSLRTLREGGVQLQERSCGVFVESAWSADPTFPSTKLRAGDLLVNVDDRWPVSSLADVQLALEAMRQDPAQEDLVTLRVLRRRPYVPRCPNAGHALKETSTSSHPLAVCFRCQAEWPYATCDECQFSLCKRCVHQVDAASMRPPTREYEVDFACTRLQFNERADVGRWVLVFWQNLAQWAVGVVEAYDLVRGHTVLYPDFNSREMVLNFNTREYRVLASGEKKMKKKEEAVAAVVTEKKKEAAAEMSREEGEERILLTEQERTLLQQQPPSRAGSSDVAEAPHVMTAAAQEEEDVVAPAQEDTPLPASPLLPLEQEEEQDVQEEETPAPLSSPQEQEEPLQPVAEYEEQEETLPSPLQPDEDDDEDEEQTSVHLQPDQDETAAPSSNDEEEFLRDAVDETAASFSDEEPDDDGAVTTPSLDAKPKRGDGDDV